MSTATDEMIRHAREVHKRLLFPPNGIADAGIDLKRRPPPPHIEKAQEVLEHQLKINVTITEFPAIDPDFPMPLKLKDIVKAVSRAFGITVQELKGESRRQKYVKPRHIIFYIAIRHTGMSRAAIGRSFDRDHTSIMHAIKKMEELVLVDKELVSTIGALETMLIANAQADRQNNDRPTLAAESQPYLAKQWQKGLSRP